jgi:hypothetical protein
MKERKKERERESEGKKKNKVEINSMVIMNKTLCTNLFQ